MKVLVVWYDLFQYVSKIALAFEELEGVQAKGVVLPYVNQCCSWNERVLSKLGVKRVTDKYYKRLRDALMSECEHYEPNLVVFLNANYSSVINDKMFEFMKSKKITPAIWFVDGADGLGEYSREYLQKFKLIYSFDNVDAEHIQKKYLLDRVTYIPLGVSKAYTDVAQNKLAKIYDISFVGVQDKNRLAILEKVAEYCVKNDKKMVVYGQMWKHRPIWHRIRHEYKFKKKYPNLYGFVVNKYLKPEEVAELYAKSKICLNIVRTTNRENPRSFEILGTNSFQLVAYNEQLARVFENRKHLVMYKSQEELEQLLDYYLNNDSEREKIAQCGYELVVKKYTLSVLVQNIIDDMKARG